MRTDGIVFRAQRDPDEAVLQTVADTMPENPFHAPAYIQARRRQGWSPVAFLKSTAHAEVGCTAFLVQGRIHRDLRIISAPEVDHGDPIWQTIREFCRNEGITRLQIQSFGSACNHVPVLGRETSRQRRREYVLDLDSGTPPLTLSSNHRRNLKRAERADIRVVEATAPSAGEPHAELIDQSMSRRRGRGEPVSADTPSDTFRLFLETGAGVIFQALSPDGTVLSSILVLLSRRGAYYHSAGTSPDGMTLGASQLLICGVAQHLRDRGIVRFNLGGAAEEQAGLARFKAGFGARTVESEAASFDVARGTRRAIVAVAQRLRAGLGR